MTYLPFDHHEYTRLPNADAAATIALASALLAEAPKSPPKAVESALKRLESELKRARAAWQPAAAAEKGPDPRLADQRVDNAFAQLHQRLAAYAALPSTYANAATAARILAQLFPDGLSFLKLPYQSQWAECERRLVAIKTAGLAAELEEVAGRDFLVEVRRAHAEYGEALGTTKARPQDTAPKIRDLMLEVRRAAQSYVLRLLAWADETVDEAGAVQSALRPVDALRAAQLRRAGGRSEPEASAAAEPIELPPLATPAPMPATLPPPEV